MTNNNYMLGPYTQFLFLFCSGGVPSNRITPEFSKWASDGELAIFMVYFFPQLESLKISDNLKIGIFRSGYRSAIFKSHIDIYII